MNSALPALKSRVQVITEPGEVTIRLPPRQLADPREVVQRIKHLGAIGSMIVVPIWLFMATLVYPMHTTLMGAIKVAFLVGTPIITIVALFVFYCRRHHVGSLLDQKSFCELKLVSDELIIREPPPYRDFLLLRLFWPTTVKVDPLAIGRLQIERIDVRYSQEGEYYEPYMWSFLNGIDYSLIADTHSGRRFRVLAHAYPRDVLRDAAIAIKQHLDAYRRAYDAKLSEARPGVILPDYGDGIPIYFGPRFREPKEKPDRPEDAKSALTHRDGDLVIHVPRGDQMEAIEFAAREFQLTIRRELLLGHIQHVIRRQDLRKLYVKFSESENSANVELIVQFFDPKLRKVQTLELLEGLGMHEVCWIAAELRDVCPPTERVDQVVTPRLQFSIAQLMYGTTLICVFLACATTIKPWGWVFGIQAVLLILCLTSFTGIRQLAPVTNRSWTCVEIVMASIFAFVLLFAWLIRLTSEV